MNARFIAGFMQDYRDGTWVIVASSGAENEGRRASVSAVHLQQHGADLPDAGYV